MIFLERKRIETSASYFEYDSTVYYSEIENLTNLENKLRSEYTITKDDSISLRYTKMKLKEIYRRGIISVNDLKIATAYKDSSIMLKQNKITKHLSDAYYDDGRCFLYAPF